jgi:CRP/FNR family cyclic AMP-dependent transcriptional regulator
LRGELDFDVNRRAESEIQGLARKMNLLGDKIGDLEDLIRYRIAPDSKGGMESPQKSRP